jgi:hypothetical protein
VEANAARGYFSYRKLLKERPPMSFGLASTFGEGVDARFGY